MKLYEGFMPMETKEGKWGFYPVVNEQEWDELPKVYKAMEWFPVDVYDVHLKKKVTSVPEYIEFDAVYMEPYKIRATVRVHVQEVQKILFCYFGDCQCHLYSVSGIVFQNGVRWGAEWIQDSKTGAFAIRLQGGKIAGKQGGFHGFVPSIIKRTEGGGFAYDSYATSENRCHYAFSNPFSFMNKNR